MFFQESMKRKAVGIWFCARCRKVVAGGAWVYRYFSPSCHLAYQNVTVNFNPLSHNDDLMLMRTKPFENIVAKGENAGISIFTFSHFVFYPFKAELHHMHQNEIAYALNLDQAKLLSCRNGLNR